MNETRILIRLLWMYIPRNWEFGSALSKLWNFGGFEPPTPLGTPLLALSYPTVFPSAWNSSVPAGEIFIKFYIYVFVEKIWRNVAFHSYLTRITGTSMKAYVHL
jgi:hypothetical protein